MKALVSKNPSNQIWVTGHSLAAALASLASAWLAYLNIADIAPRKNIIFSLLKAPELATTNTLCNTISRSTAVAGGL